MRIVNAFVAYERKGYSFASFHLSRNVKLIVHQVALPYLNLDARDKEFVPASNTSYCTHMVEIGAKRINGRSHPPKNFVLQHSLTLLSRLSLKLQS